MTRIFGGVLTRNRLSLHLLGGRPLICLFVFLPLFLFPVFGLAQVAEVAPQKSTHQTLGSSACEKCHKPQNAWWPKNSHYQTAEPFFEQKGKHVKIARLYGINPADMTKGNVACMRCHGTVVSGSEPDAVIDGVGCEACHGSANDYLKPHQEGKKELGENRPGRVKGLQLGMINLRDLKTRAKNCGRCHNISDSRLISAGHPAANNFFDYFVDGMAKTQHWTRPLDSSDALGNAHHEAFPAGAIAPVVAPPPPVVVPQEVVVPPTAQVAPKNVEMPVVVTPSPSAQPPAFPPPLPALPKPLPPPLPPKPRPVPPIPVQQSLAAEIDLSEVPEDVPLPPFPKIDQTTSVEEILLIIKERLDLLHQSVHKGPIK